MPAPAAARPMPIRTDVGGIREVGRKPWDRPGRQSNLAAAHDAQKAKVGQDLPLDNRTRGRLLGTALDMGVLRGRFGTGKGRGVRDTGLGRKNVVEKRQFTDSITGTTGTYATNFSRIVDGPSRSSTTDAGQTFRSTNGAGSSGEGLTLRPVGYDDPALQAGVSRETAFLERSTAVSTFSSDSSMSPAPRSQEVWRGRVVTEAPSRTDLPAASRPGQELPAGSQAALGTVEGDTSASRNTIEQQAQKQREIAARSQPTLDRPAASEPGQIQGQQSGERQAIASPAAQGGEQQALRSPAGQSTERQAISSPARGTQDQIGPGRPTVEASQQGAEQLRLAEPSQARGGDSPGAQRQQLEAPASPGKDGQQISAAGEQRSINGGEQVAQISSPAENAEQRLIAPAGTTTPGDSAAARPVRSIEGSRPVEGGQKPQVIEAGKQGEAGQQQKTIEGTISKPEQIERGGSNRPAETAQIQDVDSRTELSTNQTRIQVDYNPETGMFERREVAPPKTAQGGENRQVETGSAQRLPEGQQTTTASEQLTVKGGEPPAQIPAKAGSESSGTERPIPQARTDQQVTNRTGEGRGGKDGPGGKSGSGQGGSDQGSGSNGGDRNGGGPPKSPGSDGPTSAEPDEPGKGRSSGPEILTIEQQAKTDKLVVGRDGKAVVGGGKASADAGSDKSGEGRSIREGLSAQAQAKFDELSPKIKERFERLSLKTKTNEFLLTKDVKDLPARLEKIERLSPPQRKYFDDRRSSQQQKLLELETGEMGDVLHRVMRLPVSEQPKAIDVYTNKEIRTWLKEFSPDAQFVLTSYIKPEVLEHQFKGAKETLARTPSAERRYVLEQMDKAYSDIAKGRIPEILSKPEEFKEMGGSFIKNLREIHDAFEIRDGEPTLKPGYDAKRVEEMISDVKKEANKKLEETKQEYEKAIKGLREAMTSKDAERQTAAEAEAERRQKKFHKWLKLSIVLTMLTAFRLPENFVQ